MSKIYLAEKSQLDSIGGSFCTCSTAAATAAKTASLSNFILKTGAQVAVKFTYANTASSPTLNVNGTGAKSIYYHNSAIPAAMLMAGGVYFMVYDGSRWQLLGNHFPGGSGNTLGACQFYEEIKNKHYSGSELSFSGSSPDGSFSTPSTSSGAWSQTFCYGTVNFGQYVKQGYKRLFMNASDEGAYDSADVGIYISNSPGTSGAVASQTFSFGNSSGTEYKTCMFDISNLSGSYYFIITVNDTTRYHSFHLKASNIYLLT